MELVEIIKRVQRRVAEKDDGIPGIKTWTAIAKAVGADISERMVDIPMPPQGAFERVDDRSEKAIATLHRKLQPIARQLVQLAAKEGITVKILSGTRTYAEQDALYAKGNVTKARGGYSNHNFGVAFDTGIFVNGKYIDDEYERKRFSGAEMERLYTKLSKIGKSLGLAWGGDWQGFEDQPHFQLEPPWAAGMSERAMLTELRRRHDNGIDAFA